MAGHRALSGRVVAHTPDKTPTRQQERHIKGVAFNEFGDSSVLEIIDRDALAQNATKMGRFLVEGLTAIQKKHPDVIHEIRGIGLLIGIEMGGEVASFDDKKPASVQWVSALHEAGMLTIPAGQSVVRFLPALNLTQAEAEEGLGLFEQTIEKLTA